MGKQRDRFTDIAKGIGISLVVAGHSGVPNEVHDWIYSFHMPLFFICSGFYMKRLETIGQVLSFVKRRLKSLWRPYVLTSLAVLLILVLCSDSLSVAMQDALWKGARIVFTMTGHDIPWLNPFWFFSVLFYASVCMAVMNYLLCCLEKILRWRVSNLSLSLALFIASLCAFYVDSDITMIKMVCQTCFFMSVGTMLHSHTFILSRGVLVELALAVLGISLVLPADVDMLIVNFTNFPIFAAVGIMGTIMTLGLSVRIEQRDNWITRICEYLGSKSLVIFMFHIIVMRLVYVLIEYLSTGQHMDWHEMLNLRNPWMSPLYIVVGITVPLIGSWLYNRALLCLKKNKGGF